MAVTMSGAVSVSASVSDQRTAITGALNEVGNRSTALSATWAIVSGIAAGQGDKAWSDTRTVLTTATDSIDVAGVLTNAFGSTESFVKVKAIVIAAASTNTTTLQIARPASATGLPLFAATSDALAPLSAGGFFCWCDPAAGITATGGTGDIITVINSAGASAVYTVVIVGTSA